MTIDLWLKSTYVRLAESSTSPQLDALLLLAHTLDTSKAWIRAHGDEVMEERTLNLLTRSVNRRHSGEPIAYITRVQEFYGREFFVNKHVLVPRPESESMIDLLIQFSREKMMVNPRIADVGSGSGCLGITAALDLKTAHVDFYDCDEKTFIVSKRNARRFSVRHAQYYIADILEPNSGLYDLILANLPYVPDGYPVNNSALHEPALALFAGKDGLDAYRKLFSQLAGLSWKPRAVITESLQFQHIELDAIAEKYGYSLYLHDGLARLYVPQ